MRDKGFTLIEMLVVISIISLLAIFLLPNVLGASERASQLADQKNLQEIYSNLRLYKDKRKHYPLHGGHKLLLGPWVDGIIEKSDLNRDRYFRPGTNDPYALSLRQTPLNELWVRYDDLSSSDTHYAGLNKKETIAIERAGTPIAGTDNELGRTWNDGTIHILMGDGTVKALMKVDLVEYGWPQDDNADYAYPVGPDSGHPLLQKLEY